MARYSNERKAAVLVKLLPPLNRSIPAVAEEDGISTATLYNWRNQARQQGQPVPGSGKRTENWSAEAKLAVIIETAALSAAEFSEYCRSKGLYPDQVAAWKVECLRGIHQAPELTRQRQVTAKQDKKRIKELERELHRKEKALAEAAALLILRKKLNALWDTDEVTSPHFQSGSDT